MPYVSQSETNWCWAACGEMIMQPRGIGQTQCSLASAQFALTCCPSPGAPNGCNKGCWPDLCYPSHGLPTKRTTSQLSQPFVSSELAKGRPVQVCYQWAGSRSTHVALIVDEYPNGDFEVHDPWSGYGRGRRQFSQIQAAYGLGTWIQSFTF
ncbi:papain-like cysteine protease family protein [Sphingomonas cavernae]|uniref:papain-like cysteine protease family protein n=1 Tax=Sphingomonas cavernae TaxID=2320861 RepID=UPI0016043F73|nr:papain-like cysteine protease family protein [Sphingomonas cavernae]